LTEEKAVKFIEIYSGKITQTNDIISMLCNADDKVYFETWKFILLVLAELWTS